MTSLEDFLELEWIEGGADDEQPDDQAEEAFQGADGDGDGVLRLLLLQHAGAARWPWLAWERWATGMVWKNAVCGIKYLERTPCRTGICFALHRSLRCRGIGTASETTLPPNDVSAGCRPHARICPQRFRKARRADEQSSFGTPP